ncbi:Na+/H+ antiporter NhaC family protein [Thermobrachium celere]|uniref:Na+/H+ antiporter NhaC n=1 Tax=Thermobrachium celere DSM 8682 TaxID=941824 RepID=R7RTK8_9CLOT|nr:Na+/H+ antiporter NhaC family protein [Thermobrachium celere]CDF58618.1 Na+/H+ antiporter NhaC [Thermobrachium celere DSM 8682]
MIKNSLRPFEIYGVIIFFVLSIIFCISVDISMAYGFIVSLVAYTLFFIKKGFKWKDLFFMMLKGLRECKILYVLILLIGATVSIWLSSGIVPSMIYYGFKYMAGTNFLFAAFLLISFSAVFMGTAVGTVSTIGVAVLGIGLGFGIPSNVLIGMIVSGAFIADKISPISGLLNLTLSTTNTRYKNVLKSMSVTLIPTFIITSVIYYLLGTRFAGNIDLSSINSLQTSIANSFYVSSYLLSVPVIMVLMSAFGVKIIYSILVSLFVGILISSLVQGFSIVQIIDFIIFGFKINTGSSLDRILISGGVISMIEVLIIVIGAISLSSIIEGTGVIDFFIDKFFKRIESKRELVLKTGLVSSILTTITCDQTMGIVLPSRILFHEYEKLKIKKEILARTISDTGTIIAPLMPWNVNALLIAIVTGSSKGYIPFAVLCYIAPLVTILVSYLDFEL